MTLLARLVALPVHAYRLVLSPWVGFNCRYQPTCSAYALEAPARCAAPGSRSAAFSAAIPAAARATIPCPSAAAGAAEFCADAPAHSVHHRNLLITMCFP